MDSFTNFKNYIFFAATRTNTTSAKFFTITEIVVASGPPRDKTLNDEMMSTGKERKEMRNNGENSLEHIVQCQ